MTVMADPTVLPIHWLFSCLALTIMGIRLGMRKVLKDGFMLGDYLTMAAIVCVLARTGIIHVVVREYSVIILTLLNCF